MYQIILQTVGGQKRSVQNTQEVRGDVVCKYESALAVSCLKEVWHQPCTSPKLEKYIQVAAINNEPNSQGCILREQISSFIFSNKGTLERSVPQVGQ